MSVPKIIHYCWFGDRPLTEVAKRSLESWQQYAPGYRIKRWDESNSPLDDCDFVRSAYEAGRWAFVSDYVRFWVLYHHGGIYMDVGSKLIKDISSLTQYCPFSALEESTKTATTGLIACCASYNPIVAEVLRNYRNLQFENTPEFMQTHTVNEMFTTVLERNGFIRRDVMQLVAGWTLLPSEYFSPVYSFGGYHISKNTYSVHHGSGSWITPELRVKKAIVRRIAPVVGKRPAEIIGRIIGELKCNGLVRGLNNIRNVSLEVAARKRMQPVNGDGAIQIDSDGDAFDSNKRGFQ